MADDIPEFTCRNWNRSSLGRVAYVECDKERPRDGVSLLGPVIINGTRYVCTGVECIVGSSPIREGEKIGLLIEGET